METLEALRSSHLLLDEPVVLFYDVVKIFDSTKFAILRQDLFILRRGKSFRVSAVLIYTNRKRQSPMICPHHLPKESFCRGNIAFRTEHEFNCISFFIQGTVEIFPLFTDFDVGLI